jgi:hypothetical protein
MPPKYLIRSIGFTPEGEMILDFCVPAEDFKANGLAMAHSVTVPPGNTYGPDIDQIVRAVELLLDEVRRDFPDAAALKLSE